MSNIALHANPVFGGIEVSWTYPQANREAVSQTVVYRSTNDNVATATEIGTSGGSNYLDRLDTEILYFYWIRMISVNGTIGPFIGPAPATSGDLAKAMLTYLTAKIDAGVLAQSLKGDLAHYAQTNDDLQVEIADRIAGSQAYSQALADMQSGLTDAVTVLYQESQSRIDGLSALQTQHDTLAAANAQNSAAILADKQASVDADSALANQLDTAIAAVDDQVAGVEVNMQAKIDTTNGKVNDIGALYTAKVETNGLVGGFGVYNDGSEVQAGFDVDTLWIGRTGPDKVKPFIISNGVVYINSAVIANGQITNAKIGNAQIDTLKLLQGAATTMYSGSGVQWFSVPSTVSELYDIVVIGFADYANNNDSTQGLIYGNTHATLINSSGGIIAGYNGVGSVMFKASIYSNTTYGIQNYCASPSGSVLGRVVALVAKR